MSSALSVEARWTVLLFHGIIAVAAVGVFGAVPALVSRRGGYTVPRSGGGGTMPMAARRSFLAAQVALSVVVLVGALLFVRTIHALRLTDLGLDPTICWRWR